MGMKNEELVEMLEGAARKRRIACEATVILTESEVQDIIAALKKPAGRSRVVGAKPK